MKRELGWAVAVVAVLLVAGCFQGPRSIVGTKIGIGHCRHADVLSVAVTGFHWPPNASLSIRYENVGEPDNQERIGGFYWLTVVGANGMQFDYENSSAPGLASIAPRENLTVAWRLAGYPPEPWREFAVHFVHKDRQWTLRCSLEGDDAPAAFARNTDADGNGP